MESYATAIYLPARQIVLCLTDAASARRCCGLVYQITYMEMLGSFHIGP